MRRIVLIAAALVSAGIASAGAAPRGATSGGERVIVFGAENNRLRAYDAETGANQVVIPSAADDPENGLDINAQICFDPDHPTRFIAGEDTNQPDPLQHWGYFELFGDTVGELTADELGTLTPTYQGTESNAENYGCGFLSDGRMVTTDVGEQQPGSPPTGQLIVWFPPFTDDDVDYCKLDVEIPTASGIYVDENDRVYVGAARPGAPFNLDPGGVYRYSGPFPTSNDAAGGCGRTDGTSAPLADTDRIGKALFIAPNPLGALTASGIARSAEGTFYVSSVFTGVIAEYDAAGEYIRNVLQPAPGDVVPPYATGTPYGIGVAPDGTIYYADLGVVIGPPPGPGAGTGTVRKIELVDGEPQAPVTLLDDLEFPDGIGIYVVPGSGDDEPAGTTTSTAATDDPVLPLTGRDDVLLLVPAIVLAVALGYRARFTKPL